MTRYIAQRLLAGLLTAFIVSLIIFAISRIASGDLVMNVAMEMTGGCCTTEEENLAKIREHLGLDRPLQVQYLSWIAGWVTGNWGESIFSSERIWENFNTKLLATLQLVAMTQAIAVLVGIPAGVLMALKRDSWIDNLGRSVSSISLALPIFWTATLLLVAGIQFLDWDPKTGYLGFPDNLIGNLALFWAALFVGIPVSVSVALMMRSSALAVLHQDYVQAMSVSAASAFLHTLRYTLVSAAIILGLTFPAIVGGTLIIERIFALDGVGSMLAEAINQRDYPITESLALFFAVWVVAANTLVDLACGWLTPDVRSSRKSPREEWDHLANPVRLV